MRLFSLSSLNGVYSSKQLYSYTYLGLFIPLNHMFKVTNGAPGPAVQNVDPTLELFGRLKGSGSNPGGEPKCRTSLLTSLLLKLGLGMVSSWNLYEWLSMLILLYPNISTTDHDGNSKYITSFY